MGSLALNVLTPLVSVLLGAALTYWLNVRTRRRSAAEDLVNAAIAAVAIVEANASLGPRVVAHEVVDPERGRKIAADLILSAIENHNKRGLEAREALARVLAIDDRVRPYYLDEDAVFDRSEEIIAVLKQIRSAVAGRA